MIFLVFGKLSLDYSYYINSFRKSVKLSQEWHIHGLIKLLEVGDTVSNSLKALLRPRRKNSIERMNTSEFQLPMEHFSTVSERGSKPGVIASH